MNTYSNLSHSIKHRRKADNSFITPPELAVRMISLVPLINGDSVLDPARGLGAFYDNFPQFVTKDWCDISAGEDFLKHSSQVDWIITNPPYSDLDRWFEKSCLICRKGFAYLLGFINITPRRIELTNKYGFGLTMIHLCKVFQWFGISAFVVFEKGKDNIILYDRVVWH